MQDHIPVTISDLLRILKKYRKKITFFSAFCAIVVTIGVLIRHPTFMSDATFREKTKSQTETSKNLNLALIFGNQEGSENAAISLMKSRRLLEKVVADLGLQGEIVKERWPIAWLKNAIANIGAEIDLLSNSMTSSVRDASPSFYIKDIIYQGEEPLHLMVTFDTEGNYQVSENHTIKLGETYVGKEVSFRIAGNPAPGTSYKLKILPMTKVVQSILDHLQIWSDPRDKSLLHLKYYGNTRPQSSALLNSLMDAYIAHLKTEQQRIANEQIAYLHRRQDAEALKLKTILEDHAQALTSNMATIESLSAIQQNYSQRLLLIDLELERLRKGGEEGLVYYDRYNDGADTGVINDILAEIRTYRQQADSINVALRQIFPAAQHNKSSIIAEQIDEIDRIKRKANDTRSVLAAIETGTTMPHDTSLPSFKDWSKALKKTSKETDPDCTSKFKIYLANMLHLFDVEEKLATERLTHQQKTPLEFQGIDLHTANQLYMTYSKNLSDIQAEIVHHEFIIDQMKDQTFEPSSLSSFLTDPVSHDMIIKASDLSLRIRDQANRSQKELERIREDLDQQRSFLTMHVAQMLQLLKQREKLFQEKIIAIQNMQLELIHQKISVLDKHLSDYIQNRIQHFKREKTSIEGQQLAIKNEMEKMPNKWASEKLIDLHLEMSQKMIEELSKLVESKNISTHLDVTQSAPLDKALPPIHPQNPNLIFFAFLGGTVGFLFSSAFVFMRSTYRGAPATQNSLMAHGAIVAGDLSDRNRSDTLATLAAYLENQQGKTLLLMVSDGLDYQDEFADFLAKRGAKIVINKRDGILDQEVDPLKHEYDWMIASTTLPPCGGQGKLLMNTFDCAVITITDETVQDVLPLINRNHIFIFNEY